MNKYTKPIAEFTFFSVEDIITKSGVIIDAVALTGADKAMYEIYSQNSDTPNTQVSVFTW